MVVIVAEKSPTCRERKDFASSSEASWSFSLHCLLTRPVSCRRSTYTDNDRGKCYNKDIYYSFDLEVISVADK